MIKYINVYLHAAFLYKSTRCSYIINCNPEFVHFISLNILKKQKISQNELFCS